MHVSTTAPGRTRGRGLKRAGLAALAGLVALAAVLVGGALRFRPSAVSVEPVRDIAVDAQGAAERLAAAVRFRTISHADAALTDTSAFRAFHAFLEGAFPRVHGALAREVVSGLSLLYRWPGRDTTQRPVLLLAHQDVVPVTSGSEAGWTHDAFAGVLADGYVWGRGTLDDKSGVMGLLEAVETLLRDGFTPARTVYLAFGHDEERGGEEGAFAIARLLQARGVALEYVVDEGGMIAEGLFPGLDAPVALVGVAEKGYLTLELTAVGEGGHSSAPPPSTSVGILARAVARLEDHPFPARIDGGTRLLLERVGPYQPFAQRLVLANLWLFEPLAASLMTRDPLTAAGVRTTTAATMFRGSDKDNVLPIEATAAVNFRILPGETRASVLARVRSVVDDPRVRIEALPFGSEPSPVSDVTSPAYRLLERTIRETAPEDVIVAPYLLTGATDSRYFLPMTDNVFRFLGGTLSADQIAGIHGTDERIAVAEYARAVRTYYQLLRNTNAL